MGRKWSLRRERGKRGGGGDREEEIERGREGKRERERNN